MIIHHIFIQYGQGEYVDHFGNLPPATQLQLN